MVQFVKLHLLIDNEDCIVTIDKIIGVRKNFNGGTMVYFSINEYWLVKETVEEISNKITAKRIAFFEEIMQTYLKAIEFEKEKY